MQNNPQPQRLFTQNLPCLNIEVPMLFYIPENPQMKLITSIINKYGGIVVSTHDCASVQIAPFEQYPLEPRKYFCGPVYNLAWLTHSIKQGELLLKEDYLIDEFEQDLDIGNKRLLLPKLCRITVSEWIKYRQLYTFFESEATCSLKSFAKQVYEVNCLPGRQENAIYCTLRDVANLNFEKFLYQIQTLTEEEFHFINQVKFQTRTDLQWVLKESQTEAEKLKQCMDLQMPKKFWFFKTTQYQMQLLEEQGLIINPYESKKRETSTSTIQSSNQNQQRLQIQSENLSDEMSQDESSDESSYLLDLTHELNDDEDMSMDSESEIKEQSIRDEIAKNLSNNFKIAVKDIEQKYIQYDFNKIKMSQRGNIFAGFI
ncbi:UNKNOWN [Stylonychia lemnae]|uniref:BRCT domain-containing protein n=1 Tax=Stylonychia lemnae TaxID=5949 RepID=A0A078AP36_STYLE|nr:UNKNOWN [Stylonychia lemnae]|eukprot:CDW83884.1 UNKNOWN [Stylonychia lemnae]